MANYNKVILLGNLTRDPQLSYTPNQTAVVDFGLATNRKWTGQDGSAREETCFVDCRAFGRSAENINKYCQKGRPLLVEGRLTFNSWQAQDGSKRSKLRVTVERFQFVGTGGGGAGYEGGASAGESRADVDSQAPAASDDDIPF
jgi:single-strand DNA-binding protein